MRENNFYVEPKVDATHRCEINMEAIRHEQIAMESAERLNPKTDGERVTYFNVILSAIEQSKMRQ